MTSRKVYGSVHAPEGTKEKRKERLKTIYKAKNVKYQMKMVF